MVGTMGYTAKSRLSSTRTVRSALLAVGSCLLPPYGNSGHRSFSVLRGHCQPSRGDGRPETMQHGVRTARGKRRPDDRAIRLPTLPAGEVAAVHPTCRWWVKTVTDMTDDNMAHRSTWPGSRRAPAAGRRLARRPSSSFNMPTIWVSLNLDFWVAAPWAEQISAVDRSWEAYV